MSIVSLLKEKKNMKLPSMGYKLDIRLSLILLLLAPFGSGIVSRIQFWIWAAILIFGQERLSIAVGAMGGLIIGGFQTYVMFSMATDVGGKMMCDLIPVLIISIVTIMRIRYALRNEANNAQ